jgi:hypothetical protein
MVSDYRLDNWVRSPAEAKDFSSNLCVQTSSEAHLASYPVGTGGLFMEVKLSLCVMLTTHHILAPKSKMSKSYTSSPFGACMVVVGQLYYTFTELKLCGKVHTGYNVDYSKLLRSVIGFIFISLMILGYTYCSSCCI